MTSKLAIITTYGGCGTAISLGVSVRMSQWFAENLPTISGIGIIVGMICGAIGAYVQLRRLHQDLKKVKGNKK